MPDTTSRMGTIWAQTRALAHRYRLQLILALRVTVSALSAFVLVEKTTSKYRVPADASAAAGRQALLDRAYADALERQRAMQVAFSPREISEMADAYTRSQSVVMVTRGDLRRIARSSPVLARLAAWRQPAREWMRRRRILR